MQLLTSKLCSAARELYLMSKQAVPEVASLMQYIVTTAVCTPGLLTKRSTAAACPLL